MQTQRARLPYWHSTPSPEDRGHPSAAELQALGEIQQNERDYLEGLITRHQPSPVTTVPGEAERPYPRQTSCSLGSYSTSPGVAPNVRYLLR